MSTSHHQNVLVNSSVSSDVIEGSGEEMSFDVQEKNKLPLWSSNQINVNTSMLVNEQTQVDNSQTIYLKEQQRLDKQSGKSFIHRDSQKM